jgi:hypothetical protein
MYARGLNFSLKTPMTNLLYPLSVYTPNFESVHSLLSTEMARLVSHRMRKLGMAESETDFAHAWMYNAVRGQVWSPGGMWSSGKFHPRIVSALAARRDHLVDLFYFARMVLPKGAMKLSRVNVEHIDSHLACQREIAREALNLYSTGGTVVQPLLNQLCLGLYTRKESKDDSGERTDMELKRLLLEPFAFGDDAESLRVGNMDLLQTAKTYATVIRP